MDAYLSSVDARLLNMPIQVISKPVKMIPSISKAANLVDNFPIAIADVVSGGCELNKLDSFSLWHHDWEMLPGQN